MNSDLILSSKLKGGVDGDSFLALLGVDYTLNDNWVVNAQLIAINSSSDSPLLFPSEDARVAATITYTF